MESDSFAGFQCDCVAASNCLADKEFIIYAVAVSNTGAAGKSIAKPVRLCT